MVTPGDRVGGRLELAAVGERTPVPQDGADLPDGIAGVTPVRRGSRVGEPATDAAEIKRLKTENAELRQARAAVSLTGI